jgi:hypothetical protein
METLEAFKLLLEVDAGENATHAAYAFIAYQVGCSLLTFVGVMLGLWMILRLIRWAITATADNEELIRECRDLLGTGVPGVLTPTERTDTKRRLRELAAEERARRDKERGE